MEKKQLVMNNFVELLAELVIDDVVTEFNKKKLYEEIDLALLNGEKQKFYELTTKLKSYNRLEKKVERSMYE